METGKEIKALYLYLLPVNIPAMKLNKIKAYNDKTVNVIIETPKGSQNKYVYDEAMKIFKLKKTLPLGMTFPFDFGFVPNTKSGDGDPLDVLVIMEEPAFAGCMVKCRVIALLKAKQQERNGDELRNDRIVAVAEASHVYSDIKKLEDLNEHLSTSIEHFFVDYNKHEGKSFFPLGWENTDSAMNRIKEMEIN